MSRSAFPAPAESTVRLARRTLEIETSATVRLADAVAQMRRRGVDVLDFTAGRPVEDTPAYICDAAVRALTGGDTHQTMAQGKPEFREACALKLARDNGISADPEANVMATMGAKHGLLLAMLATIDPGDETSGVVRCPRAPSRASAVSGSSSSSDRLSRSVPRRRH